MMDVMYDDGCDDDGRDDGWMMCFPLGVAILQSSTSTLPRQKVETVVAMTSLLSSPLDTITV